MEPRIIDIPRIKLVGKKVTMSVTNNKTKELWKGFMPFTKAVKEDSAPELYSVEVYPSVDYFRSFNPRAEFEKWAALPVTNLEYIPSELEPLIIGAGKYAVFHYKGKSGDAADFYQKIYTQWLPDSGYSLDDRPHFTIMGEKYKNNDPDSEEDIWIPVIRE